MLRHVHKARFWACVLVAYLIPCLVYAQPAQTGGITVRAYSLFSNTTGLGYGGDAQPIAAAMAASVGLPLYYNASTYANTSIYGTGAVLPYPGFVAGSLSGILQVTSTGTTIVATCPVVFVPDETGGILTVNGASLRMYLYNFPSGTIGYYQYRSKIGTISVGESYVELNIAYPHGFVASDTASPTTFPSTRPTTQATTRFAFDVDPENFFSAVTDSGLKVAGHDAISLLTYLNAHSIDTPAQFGSAIAEVMGDFGIPTTTTFTMFGDEMSVPGMFQTLAICAEDFMANRAGAGGDFSVGALIPTILTFAATLFWCAMVFMSCYFSIRFGLRMRDDPDAASIPIISALE